MLVEGCKHEIEVTVPVDEIARETDRVVADIQQKAKLPGFRPGKAPASLIRTKFSRQVRDDVLENLLPKYFRQKVEEEHLEVVGRPNVKDVHFHEGEPLRFKAEFEVAPEIELKDYRGVTIHYSEPQVSDEDIAKRLEEIREQKAQFVNAEPRAVVDGDYAVVTLDSLSGVEPPSIRMKWCCMWAVPIPCRASPKRCAACRRKKRKSSKLLIRKTSGKSGWREKRYASAPS